MPAANPEEIKRYRENLQAEIDGATMYKELAKLDTDPERQALLEELSESERRHADLWEEKLREAGAEPGDKKPTRRVRLIGWLARRFGLSAVLPILTSMEGAGAGSYSNQPDAKSLAREERSHAQVFSSLGKDAGTVNVAQKEKWHRTDGGGTLRATVFGVNDGLVSNLSLVMGVAGANPGGRFVLLTGIAGLLAGSFSMAAGEYISMTSQRELFERQIALEKEELEASPEEEERELALIYRAKGIPKADAERLAKAIVADKDVALDTLAKEELGLDPESLGSPVGAALGSFIAFAAGALMPVLPFLFLQGNGAVIASAVLSMLSLLGVGAALSLFTGRSPWLTAGRMILLGFLAAGITYLVGHVIGVSVAG